MKPPPPPSQQQHPTSSPTRVCSPASSAEIRSSHPDEPSITLSTISKLPYITAVLQESLRMAPPVPGGLPRVVPSGGATVCGHLLSAGTNVSFGHRDCIGKNLAYAEMRLILARLLWNFELGLPEGQGSSMDWSRRFTYVL